MRLLIPFAIGIASVAAAPNARVTARAVLPREGSNADIGVIVNSRSCDYPETLSRSGSFVQCCQPGQRCPFYTTCSGGTLFAQSTRVFCDQGTCNTAIVVSDLGPSDRSSYLACWATSFGTSPIFIMQGALSPATTTPTIGSASSGASLTPTTSTSSPSPSSRAKSDVTSKKNLDGGATAGITISGVAVLLCCVALYRWWRKRNKNKKDVTRDKSIVAENNNWEKPEIDGKSVAFAELYAEKEATELPSTTITPVELPAGAPPSPQEFHSRQDRL